MSLVVAALVKNEANRYLPQALDAWGTFADEIVILDDNSDDGTYELCEEFGCETARRETEDAAWGHESPARKELYERAMAQKSDWVLWLDADMVPADDPRVLCNPWLDSVAFPLFDLWSQEDDGELYYRSDKYWTGHVRPRIWMIRPPLGDGARWSGRGIHCGHLPSNLSFQRPAVAPNDYGLLHYAYLDPLDREAKTEVYLKCEELLRPAERMHAATIADPTPNLKLLPFEPRWHLEKQRSSAEPPSG